jgi:orotate phosphoribosyltransferase
VTDDGNGNPVENGVLFERVGMVADGGEVRRSNPLASPADFRKLAARLLEAVDRPFDLIIVRDLFGDRVLGYELAQLAGKPVSVSYDREGIIALQGRSTARQNARVLIAADTHFTTQSIQAAASGAEQAGMEVVGAAILLQTVRGEYPFPVWTLESRA